MRLITLAEGGREVSALGFGCNNFGHNPFGNCGSGVSATVALMALERTGVHCSSASFDPRAA